MHRSDLPSGSYRSLETPVLDWTNDIDLFAEEKTQRSYDKYALQFAADLKDGKLPYYWPYQSRLLEKALLIVGKDLQGVGADIGSGAGYITSLISKYPGVGQVYSVEISTGMVNLVMPITFRVTGAHLRKIVRVIGSFNNLRIEDNSLDFIVASAALHHSDSLARTIYEMNRVLKMGGWAIVLDRWQPDSMTADEVDQALGSELSKDMRALYGYPDDYKLTRREMGEHEIRLCEWKTYFIRAGFEVFPFPLYYMGRGRLTRFLSIFTRLFFRCVGNQLLKRRIWHIGGFSYPIDLSWLYKGGPAATNLIMACCKRDTAT